MGKTLYHGTATPYLPAILRDGLRFAPENRWAGRMNLKDCTARSIGISKWGAYGDASEGDYPGVYLAGLKTAALFAELRARYLRTAPGGKVHPPGDLVGMVKNPGTVQIADAQAAILQVNLPDHWPLMLDPFSLSMGGCISAMPIPASCLSVYMPEQVNRFTESLYREEQFV